MTPALAALATPLATGFELSFLFQRDAILLGMASFFGTAALLEGAAALPELDWDVRLAALPDFCTLRIPPLLRLRTYEPFFSSPPRLWELGDCGMVLLL